MVECSLAAIPKSAGSALKDLRKKYREIKSMQASFRESFQWKMTGEATERDGKIVLADGNRFKIETPEQTIVSDGLTLQRFNRLRNQVMIESVEKAGALLPNKILLEFADDFEASAISPLQVDGKEGYRLDLKATDPEKALLAEAAIWVVSAEQKVVRIQLTDLNGNITKYTLSDIRFDFEADSSKFQFHQPDGVEVFDLR